MLRSSTQRLHLPTQVIYRQLHLTRTRALDKASISFTYTKQNEHHHEPDVSPSTGKRLYVVSPKESTEHDVPGGPYPTADPYIMPAATEPPPSGQISSTSTSYASPTTSRVPQNPSGVGESAAVRYRSAPGAMKEGSNGGVGLMNESTTTGTNRLSDRNPPPDLK